MTNRTQGAVIRPGRQVGNTARQMLAAPQKAVFVWVNHQLQYPRVLATRIGRHDLEIVSPSWLSDRRWLGREFTGIVLDHAVALDDRQWEAYWEVKNVRVRS